MPRINVDLRSPRFAFHDDSDPAIDGLANLAASLASLGPQMQQIRMHEDDRAFARAGEVQDRQRAGEVFDHQKLQWQQAGEDRQRHLANETSDRAFQDEQRAHEKTVWSDQAEQRQWAPGADAAHALGGLTMGGIDATGDGQPDVVTTGMLPRMNVDVDNDGVSDMQAPGARASAKPAPLGTADRMFNAESAKVREEARKRELDGSFSAEERDAWEAKELDRLRKSMGIQTPAAPAAAQTPAAASGSLAIGGAAPAASAPAATAAPAARPIHPERVFTPEQRLNAQHALAALDAMDPALRAKHGYTDDVLARYRTMLAEPEAPPEMAPAMPVDLNYGAPGGQFGGGAPLTMPSAPAAPAPVGAPPSSRMSAYTPPLALSDEHLALPAIGSPQSLDREAAPEMVKDQPVTPPANGSDFLSVGNRASPEGTYDHEATLANREQVKSLAEQAQSYGAAVLRNITAARGGTVSREEHLTSTALTRAVQFAKDAADRGDDAAFRAAWREVQSNLHLMRTTYGNLRRAPTPASAGR